MRKAVVLVALLTLPLSLRPGHAAAQASELFFSEYVEGAGNDKALEIYNGTGAPVDLSAGGYVTVSAGRITINKAPPPHL